MPYLFRGVEAEFFFVAVDVGDAFFHPLGSGCPAQVVVKKLPGAAGEIFRIGAAAQVVELAVVVPQPSGFVIATQRKKQLDALILWHGVVGVVV